MCTVVKLQAQPKRNGTHLPANQPIQVLGFNHALQRLMHFLGFLVHLTDQSKSQASTMNCRGFMEAHFLGFLVHPTDQFKSWASTMHYRGSFFREAHSLGFLVHPTDRSKSCASTMHYRGFTKAHFLGFLVHPTDRSKPWSSTMHRVHGSSLFRVSWTPPPTNPRLGLQPCIIEGSWKLIFQGFLYTQPIQALVFNHAQGSWKLIFQGFLDTPTNQSKSWASTMHYRGFMEARCLGFLVHHENKIGQPSCTMIMIKITHNQYALFLLLVTFNLTIWTMF